MKKLVTTLMAFIAFAHFAFAQFPNCTEPFISEYVEGSNKNRALEIYNPTSDFIDMSIYSIKVFASGPNNPSVISLSGFLAPKEVFVCGHDQADSGILALCDLTSSELKFDGDDAVGLYKNNVLIDMIGEIGVNPGNTGWQVGAGFTKDYTLRRGYDVRSPTPYWTQSVFEWDIIPIDDFSGLGDNNNVCAGATVQFAAQGSDVDEGVGVVALLITTNSPFPYDLTGQVAHNPHTADCIDPDLATRNDDYQSADPLATTILFDIPAGIVNSGYVVIYIFDDGNFEPDEAICFELLTLPNITPVSGADKHTMMILNNDPPTGINELNGDNVKIYPALADEYLFIEGVPGGLDIWVSIYNIFGQKVISKDGDMRQGKTRVKIEALTPGMYVLSLESLRGTVTKKFIKN